MNPAEATRRRRQWAGVAALAVLSLERAAGAGGTRLRVPEIDSTFTFVLAAGAGLSYFVTDTVAVNAGYRFQHISNGDTSKPNRGFNSDSGVVGVSFYFK